MATASSCLSFALNDNFTMSNTYRQTICEYILKNWEHFCNNTELLEQTPLYYYQSMILGHKYASSCEIEVAAKLFHRQNNVWLECKNSDNIIPHVLTIFESYTLTHDQPLQLMFRYQHYQYLTPRSNLVTNDVPSDQICGKINTKYQ